MSSKINLQTCEYACKSSIFQDNQLILFKIEVKFSKGLNLLVGENGCGKSTVIDAIRVLLSESEFSRKGVSEEDFHVDYQTLSSKPVDCIEISGIFSELSEAQKVEYLTWLTDTFDAKLNLEIQHAEPSLLYRWICLNEQIAFQIHSVLELQSLLMFLKYL